MSGPGYVPLLRVGNDVVDLELPRMRGRSEDERFLDRILAPSERNMLDLAGDPDMELWSIWAAKEAAYKVVTKLVGAPPPFIHDTFVVAWGHRGPADGRRRGVVRHGPRAALVEVEARRQLVHSIGWGGKGAVTLRDTDGRAAVPHAFHRRDEPGARWSLPEADLRAMLTERECRPVHSRASAAVRVAARADLARALDIDERRIEIICGEGPKGRQPPHVLIDGEPSDVDVSLSHHGAWIAWAIWTGSIQPTSFPT